MPRNCSGLSAIKTGQKVKLRSMSGKSGDSHLDLYVMSKEKERLEQARLTAEKRKKNIEADLKDLTKRIEKMKKAAQGEDVKTKREGQRPQVVRKNGLKTIILGY